MHAVYCFLVKGLEEALSVFQSSPFYGLLDENNWYQEMLAVNRMGEINPLCPDEDWRGRSALSKKFVEQAQKKRWQDALEFAHGCVLWDINNALSALDEKQPGIISLEESEKALRAALASGAAEGKEWALSWAASILEQLSDRRGPFTGNVRDAYGTIRAIALDGEVSLEDPQATILFVDIHT